jgi:anti-sigma B factor antagonist
MHITTGPSGRVAVVSLKVELDLGNADQLREILLTCPDGGLVVVDMSQVTFIDSTVIGVLVAANKRCIGSGGRLHLAHLQSLPARVISLVGLDHVVDDGQDDLPG